LRHARTARAAAQALGPAATTQSIDALADQLGASSSARITFIDETGTVIGDSALSLDGLKQEENHRQRPEVIAAMAGNDAVVPRFSTTVGKSLLYVAVPWPERHGVVRAAMPLDSVRDVLAHQRLLLLLAAGLGLFVAVLVSAVVSHLAASVLGTLVTNARAVLSGGQRSIPVSSEDELGHIAGSLNRLADDRARTIDALVKERDRLNTVLNGVSEGLIALDASDRIEMVNPAASQLLSLTDNFAGKKLVEAVRVPELVDLVERTKSGSATAELALGDPARYLHARTTRLRATGGSVVVLHDVTDVKNMESMRRDLVANVSHELRTPVSIIRANAETLLDGGALEDPVQARTFVEAMHRHSERLSNLLSDLLDLARIEGGAYPLCLEGIPLRRAAQRAVDTLQRTAKNKSVSLKVEIDPELTAHADSQALDQVLVNLLDNAIKYSLDKGEVEVTATRQGQQIRVAVSDDGPGIPERHRARVFERFYRVDAGRSRALGGTGLGLSIVKHLVGLMHGSVGVEPVEPHGSTFWLTLPVADQPVRSTPDRSAA
jgi:two-component system phosphate regulon sensor histidine kinase PhoR